MKLGKFFSVVAAAVVALSVAAPSLPAEALSVSVLPVEVKDPNLEQTVTDSESYAPFGELVTLTDGHVDLGPVFNSESRELSLWARDDTGEAPVWRSPDDVVFTVGDAAQQVLPEGDAYDFTGASAGETVWALPQTQVAGVPWLGWNTQHPHLAAAVDRGVSFEFLGHQGEGDFTVFLQAGGFGEPQVLWTSAKSEVQPIWVDLLTHTHANWVFTKPGVHLVKLRVKAALQDGGEVSAEGVLRFAVGGVSADEAFAATWQGSGAEAAEAAGAAGAAGSENAVAVTSAVVGRVTLGVAVGVVALAGVVVFLVFRGRAARKEAFKVTAAGGQNPSSTSEA